MMSDHFILKDKIPVPCDLMTWARWFDNAPHRVVAQDIIDVGGTRVSTVFLGIDHSFGEGPPLLFETTIFDLPKDHALEGYQERCSTWEEAEAQHLRAIDALKRSESK